MRLKLDSGWEPSKLRIKGMKITHYLKKEIDEEFLNVVVVTCPSLYPGESSEYS